VDLKKGEEWELQPDWRGDGPFFDPNLEYYAVTQGSNPDVKTRGGPISVRRLRDHAEIAHLLDIGSVPYQCQFSANTRFLAVAHYDEMPWRFSLWDLSRGELILKLPPALATGSCAFSPDSQSLLVHYQDGTIGLHELPSGKEVKRVAIKEVKVLEAASAFRFDPRGRKVGFNTSVGVEILDLDTEKVIRLPQPAPLGGYRGLSPATWRGATMAGW
jgi:hypothetical protein